MTLTEATNRRNAAWKTAGFLLVALAALLLAFLFVRWNCEARQDRRLLFEGFIYEWVDAPVNAQSIIFIGDNLADANSVMQGKQLVPIEARYGHYILGQVRGGMFQESFESVAEPWSSSTQPGKFYLDDFRPMPETLRLQVKYFGYKTALSREFEVGSEKELIVVMAGIGGIPSLTTGPIPRAPTGTPSYIFILLGIALLVIIAVIFLVIRRRR
jgi:LPXTG-motif cell wall-anchored protein